MKDKEFPYQKYASTILFYILLIGVGYVLLRYLLPLLFPFLFAWGICFLLRPLAHKLHEKLHLPTKLLQVMLVFLVYFLIGGGVYILVFRLLTELSEFLRQIGENPAFLSESFGAVRRILSTFGENGEALLTALLNYLGEALLSFLPRVLLALFTALPRFLFAVVIGIVASVYFSLDLDRINQGVRSFLPPRAFALLLKLKGGVLKTVWGYARAYSIIFLLVLTTLLLGFCFLRIPYALLLSFTVALLDILPVIGVGTVLIPYSIYAFAVGNTWRGVGLLVLYAIIFVGRQWAEPHIIGRRFGIHPVLSLIFLYLGTKLFGFTGLLLAPLFAVAFKSLFTKEKDIEKEAPASG